MKPLFIIFWLLMSLCTHAQASNEILEVEVQGNDFSVHRFSAAPGRDSDHLLLWIAPGFGNAERAFALAEQLSQRGIETWHVDLADNLFLPKSTHTLRTIDGKLVAELISQAHRVSGRKITLASRSYGAIPVLHGAREWQRQNPHIEQSYLTGAILFSPELYREIPALGKPPVYMPITTATNVPIMLYQAGKRGNRWQLGDVISRLEQGGAEVTVKLLPGVTGVFYHEDKAPETLRVHRQLATELAAILDYLAARPMPTTVAPLQTAVIDRKPLDIELKPYTASFSPLPLSLPDSTGKLTTRDHYRDKVTVINFWATWCGPCVEEIPALNRLRESMAGEPFELISVNYAEEPETVRAFLDMVKVDYPVLLDTTGKVSASWKVLVYPATYVIDTDGKIRYAVNGAIHWDSDAVIASMNALIDETSREASAQ